jgi:hypothetical protein
MDCRSGSADPEFQQKGRPAMITVAVVVLLFIALGVAGVRWGADSRDGRDWQPVETPPLDWAVGSPRCP